MIQHLARAAAIRAADSPGDPDRETRRFICGAGGGRTRTTIPLLAELLSLPAAPAAQLSLTPAQRKAATVGLLDDEIVRLGKTGPVLLVVEDAHSIDATTLELIDAVWPTASVRHECWPW